MELNSGAETSACSLGRNVGRTNPATAAWVSAAPATRMGIRLGATVGVVAGHNHRFGELGFAQHGHGKRRGREYRFRKRRRNKPAELGR